MQMDLTSIPARVKELREILDIEATEMADKLGVTLINYIAYESGEQDIPISTLYEIASILGVDFTTLLTGRTPKMNTYSVVRNGQGAKVERYPGYNYTSLCYNFKGREMEPMVVQLMPEDERPALVSHGGQEFNYVLSGKVCVTIGKKDIVLEQGDCLYFDPMIPHGQSAVDGPASFLTVITEGKN
ncbi:MAG: helix-turn-helix domain-containing protein [Ruminococcaceae bacterium]|nr:helix-turn-helix domain-containing protein [Oscillospiraceae bacterium]